MRNITKRSGMTERRNPLKLFKEKITHIFPRLDPVALGFSFGITAGVLIFAATLFLVIKDGGNRRSEFGIA